MNTPLPPLPGSWSALSWQQLCEAWTVKMRYGANADVARAYAFLLLHGLGVVKVSERKPVTDAVSGETVYTLQDTDGALWTVTPRELSFLASRELKWFDYPYGDSGNPEQRDEKGKVIRERREPVAGYVSPMHDAIVLPEEYITVGRRHFALPQVACNNLTWQQYRALQTIAPQLFAEGVDEEQVAELQAQFLANILTPRSMALLDTAGGSIRIRPHYEYRYNAEQTDGLSKWFAGRCKGDVTIVTLFHICFQAYQTALVYYAASYPLLFQDSGKNDQLRDALAGEVGTINTIMKYAGYAEQQQVYDSNLPFVLDILNTMTKEAKEIEKINSRIKK